MRDHRFHLLKTLKEMQTKLKDVKKLPRERNILLKELFLSMNKSLDSWKSFKTNMQSSVKKIWMLMKCKRLRTHFNSRLVSFRLLMSKLQQREENWLQKK